MVIISFVRRFPLPIFFALTFLVSWGGVLIVVGGLKGIPATNEQFWRHLPLTVAAMLAGPTLSGIFLTGIVYGASGFRDLLTRLLRWRAVCSHYAAYLLIAPLAVSLSLFALLHASPVFIPGIIAAENPILHLLLGLVTGIAAGLFEELGWTGFAIPEMRRRYGIFTTGLIVGLLWGAWHFIVTLWGSGSFSETLSPVVFLPILLFSFLPPYRILMVWVYDRTGSLLLAMLMHGSLTASVRILDPLTISGYPLLTYNLLLGALLWLVVILIFITTRKPLNSPQS